MRQFTWTALAIVCLAAYCQSTPLRETRQVHIDASGSINPAEQEIETEEGNRDKRKVEHVVDAKYGVKNALLGLVFNVRRMKRGSILTGFSWEKPTTPAGPTTTEDVAILNRDKVELEIPPQLYGSSYALLTNISTTVGDFIVNSADRFGRVLEVFQPILRNVFRIKGLTIERTNEPMTTESNEIRR